MGGGHPIILTSCSDLFFFVKCLRSVFGDSVNTQSRFDTQWALASGTIKGKTVWYSEGLVRTPAPA